LDGEFSAASGTVTGQLSSDGNQVTGNYSLTAPAADTGTWKAKKK